MLKSFRSSGGLFSKGSPKREHYDSIDNLPVQLWRDINETEDHSLLVITGDYLKEELKEIWLDIYDEFIVEFGAGEKYLKYMRLKKKYALLQCKLELTGDRFNNTKMQMVAIDMENLLNAKNIKFDKIVAMMEERMHFHIDTMKTSVKRFYYRLNMPSSE